MRSWQIFRHSFRQVTNNLGAAARVSLVPFLISVLGIVVVFGLAGVSGRFWGTGAMTPGAMFLILIGVLVYLAMTISIAVNWHRFVLLNEPVTWWPRFHGARILRYFWRSLLIGLIFGAALGIVSMTLAVVMQGGSEGGLGVAILMIVAVLLGLPLFWRLSASLPGAALEGAGISDAWSKTRGAWGALLMLAVFYIGFALLTGVVGGIFTVLAAKASVFVIVKVIWELAIGWFTMMLVLSILTTLYGHYVEQRELV
jgi:hypothetical protein